MPKRSTSIIQSGMSGCAIRRSTHVASLAMDIHTVTDGGSLAPRHPVNSMFLQYDAGRCSSEHAARRTLSRFQLFSFLTRTCLFPGQRKNAGFSLALWTGKALGGLGVEVEPPEGSAVYFLVFYGVFCIGPSKTRVFLLVSAPEGSKS